MTMRAHRLDELALGGREKALALEPDLDLYRAHRVVRLAMQFVELDLQLDSPRQGLPSLCLDLLYDGKQRYTLRLLFDGVRELELPKMSPLLWLPELEIEDLRERMLEGMKFEAVSQFERRFRCLCGSISIASFEPVS